jgi:hypothetical protein
MTGLGSWTKRARHEVCLRGCITVPVIDFNAHLTLMQAQLVNMTLYLLLLCRCYRRRHRSHFIP